MWVVDRIGVGYSITFCHCRVERESGRIASRAVLANHHQKSARRWMELRLYLKYGSQRATILGCGRRAPDAGRFIVHADQELPAFLELESAIKNPPA
jgi:hypothetical protein